MKDKILYTVIALLVTYCIYLHWQVNILLNITTSQNEANYYQGEINEKMIQWLNDLSNK